MIKYKMRDKIQFEYKGQLLNGTVISVPLGDKGSQTYVVSLDNYMSYQIDIAQIKGLKTQALDNEDTALALSELPHMHTE